MSQNKTTGTHPPAALEHLIQCFGDLLFDLCETLLASPEMAQQAFRTIVKSLRKNITSQNYQDYERAWVLQIACQELIALSPHHGRRTTASEQIELDATQNVASRFKSFEFYFNRLKTEDQILLLLRDKYGLPYPEIAASLGVPEDSLKIRRSHALRALEEWLWDPQK